jgi:hypothetical protein
MNDTQILKTAKYEMNTSLTSTIKIPQEKDKKKRTTTSKRSRIERDKTN